ncbi:DUF423 domain-containing protein [Sphingomonas sp.]|uniref:DUF423 domain-containing protein n=1 Tax=Sphingomonas sp. TaxID=28214 RepID=UPI0025E48041|nr:DUF423 domain-containing protein [Sphingomonas sp.]
MRRDWLIVAAALSAAVAIGAGAFGAHGATGDAGELLKTGGLYQMVHAVAAVALANRARGATWLMLAGAAVFAFSLYGLAIGAPRIVGAITPIGGLGLIAGWIWVALSAGGARR